jgi:hypothetical protein
MKIIIETETPNDPRTMFRVLVDAKMVGEGLTAVQAQLVAARSSNAKYCPKKADMPALREQRRLASDHKRGDLLLDPSLGAVAYPYPRL